MTLVKALASMWFAAVLLVLLMVAMACATVFETQHGAKWTLASFYQSWWFELLLSLLAVNVLAAMLVRYPFSKRQYGFVVTHASILLVLGGALVTGHFGVDGNIGIMEGQTISELTLRDQPTLTITNRQTQNDFVAELDGAIFDGFVSVDNPDVPPISLGDIQAELIRYLPDSRRSQRMVDDNPHPRSAIQVSLSPSGRDDPVWVFAQQGERHDSETIVFKTLPSTEDLHHLMAQEPADKAVSKGTVKIEYRGKTFEIPVEDCTDQALSIGDTGYTVRVLRYLPHAMVDAHKKLTNVSSRPVNPYIEAELTAPDGTTEQRRSFARFPNFNAMHGSTDAEDIKLALVAEADADTTPSAPPIEVFSVPDTEMYARFNQSGGDRVNKRLFVGEPVETPWHGQKFTVLRHIEHAGWEESVTPVEPVRPTRIPAIQVKLTKGEHTEEMWLQKYQTHPVTLGPMPARHGPGQGITFGDKTLPLGFDLTLDQFQLITYPGSSRPRSYESHVTIVGTATGRVESHIISMNNPTTFGGYTLYQSSYRQDRGKSASFLSVSRDPGQPIVFAGYIAMMIGMVWVLVQRMKERMETAKRQNAETPESRNDGEALCGDTQGNAFSEHQGDGASDYPAETSGDAREPSSLRRLILETIPQLWHRRQSRWDDNEGRPCHRTFGNWFLIPLLTMMLTGSAMATPTSAEAETGAVLPQSLDLTAVRTLTTQHDGRWPPLDTVARDIVERITGDPFGLGYDPVTVLLAWTFDSEAWVQEPLIKITNAELREELQLPASQTVFSYHELARHRRFLSLVQDLARREADRKMDPLESKVSDIYKKLELLQTVFSGQAIRLIPHPDDRRGRWRPIAAPLQHKADEADPVNAEWMELRRAFLADDAKAFSAASNRLAQALEALPAKHRPTRLLIETELRYNKLAPFNLAWKIMIAGAVLAALAMLTRQKLTDGLALAAMIAGFAVLTGGLWMRWQIAGRIPASNMFESLLFLSWGMGLFAIIAIFVFHHRLIPLTASVMAALALFLADILPLDSFVRPIVPVLQDTVWMSIHVPVIMVSYSVLALGVLVAHVQLVIMAAAPRRRQLAGTIDSLHYWYIHVGTILLLAGVVTGSMWAASSWGRYWGWDPKEVWSLIALMGYLAILHVRIAHEKVPPWAYVVGGLLAIGLFAIVLNELELQRTIKNTLAFAGTLAAMAILVLARGRFATAFKSIICFWLIVMTYVGVNYALGSGLHSYGFGTGAVVQYMFTIGGIDLLVIVVLSAVYLLQSNLMPGSAAPNGGAR